MLATFACAAGICGLSLSAGRLICRLGGADGWSWLAPGVGFAALVCVASAAVALPGHGWTALAALALVAALGLVPQRASRPERRDPENADRGSAAGPWEALAAGLIVLAAVAVPFVVSGRFGILGAGQDNDLGFHLAWAEALAHGDHAQTLIARVDPGYPIGPHSLAAAFVRPFGVIPAFTGLLMAVPVLAALTSFAALRDLRPGWRVAAAVVTALPYMAASYFAEGSFKEPALALTTLTFAISLSLLRPQLGWRAGLVPGLAAVAGVLIFGHAGLVWPLGIAAVWLLAELVARGREWRSWLGAIFPALAGGLVVLLLGLLADIGRLSKAAWTGTSFAIQGAEQAAGGNFSSQISPLRVFGGWPSPSFIERPDSELAVAIATAIALLAFVYGAIWWTRRRELAIPAAALASLLIYAYARARVAPYFSAKGMVVAAPLVTLVAVRAAFSGLPGPERLARLRRGPWASAARAALGIAFVLVAAWSSLLALRNGNVSEQAHADELRSLRGLLDDQATIFVGKDDYAIWELRGLGLVNLNRYTYTTPPPQDPRAGKPTVPADFDALTPTGLDRYRYAVTTRGPYASRPPANWRLVRSTPSFEVWERIGPTARRETLDEGAAPGAILDCSTAEGRRISSISGIAAVRPAPVVGPVTAWRLQSGSPPPYNPQIHQVAIGSRVAVEQGIRLPRGRWDLSLQYQSPVGLHLRAGELRADPPAVTEPLSQYWPVGRLRSRGGGVKITIRGDGARFGALRRFVLLGTLAATPAGWPETEVPLRDACGRYVDWFSPG